MDTLKPKLPGFASLGNPIDVTGMISNEGYVDAVMEALRNDEVGAVMAIYCQTAVTDPMVIASMLVREIKKEGGLKKPLVVTMIGGEESYWAVSKLTAEKVPAYIMPERAASTMAAIINYAKIKEKISKRLKELGNH